MEASALRHFQGLVAARLGLQVREQEREALGKTLASRLQALKLSGPESYYALLGSGGAAGEAEWKHLSILLTNQESYFFRDGGQFAALRDHVLPQIISANRARRSLRLWSAGCSTGQEPYSLAILIDLLLPLRDREGWDILILGTDLSEDALGKARRAHYSAWSLRVTDQGLQKRYFQQRGGDWELDSRIRSSVTFRHGNLLHDAFPSRASGIHDLDLILCRNVFIYFGREAVATVLAKFAHSLRGGGTLMTGHAELHDTPLGDLRPRSLPGTIVYQKEPAPPQQSPPQQSRSLLPAATLSTATSAMSTPAAAAASTWRPSSFPTQPARPTQPTQDAQTSSGGPVDSGEVSRLVEAALAFLKRGDNAAALRGLAPLLREDAAGQAHLSALCVGALCVDALCVAAQAHANAGRYDEAEQHCRRAARAGAFDALPLHILARIAEERGEREEAKSLLKKVCYLAPALALPYVELGAIYEHEGDAARARTMREAALGLLQSLPPEASVPSHPLAGDRPIRIGDLREHLRQQLRRRDRA